MDEGLPKPRIEEPWTDFGGEPPPRRIRPRPEPAAVRTVLPADRDRRHLRIFLALATLLVAVVGLRLLGFWLGQLRVPVPTDAEVDGFLRSSLCFAAQRVNLFAEENGRLPDSLAEAGVPPGENWGFESLSDSRYRISVQERGRRMSYDSAVPFEWFFAEELKAQERGR